MHPTLSMENAYVPDAVREAQEFLREKGIPVVKVKLPGGVIAEIRKNSDPALICRDYDWAVAGIGKRNIGPNPNRVNADKMEKRIARMEEKKKIQQEELTTREGRRSYNASKRKKRKADKQKQRLLRIGKFYP